MILGIDPGTARVGWGLVAVNRGEIRAPAYGCITTAASAAPEARLVQIHKNIAALLKKYKPDVVSVEDLFFANNAKTAISVGQARGVVLLAAGERGIPVVSYSPLTVKRAITGSGTGDKRQVQKMITRLLRLPAVPQPDDTADALAIALTHAYSYKMKEKLV